jgi:UDP-glucose 4-epimerase
MARIVVTGSAGFVARHTIPVLESAGHTVVPFDIATNPNHDVCNYASIARMHLAAVARFAECDADPAEAYRTNVGGVITVLNAAEALGAERVVLASTGSVYMPVWQLPITEHHPITGNSHYGLSKALGEHMATLTRTPFVILRYAHLYGEHKMHGGLIDNFLSRIQRGAAPVLYGGWQSADFCYIPDVAQANLLALTTTHTNEIFNIGTGDETRIEQVCQQLCELVEYTGTIDRDTIRPVDAPRFFFDISKAQRLLGYQPRWSLAEGLQDLLAKRERTAQ